MCRMHPYTARINCIDFDVEQHNTKIYHSLLHSNIAHTDMQTTVSLLLCAHDLYLFFTQILF